MRKRKDTVPRMREMVRIIHQTWKTHDVPNDIYLPQWRESWRELNPGWEIRFWTDEDNEHLVAEHYPDLLGFYRSIDRGVIRSDVARALYLHRHGGLYVDMDFVCLRPMEPLLAPHADHLVFAWHLSERQPIPNAWMYSPPGEGFWLRFLDAARARWEEGCRIPESIAGPNTLHRLAAREGRERLSRIKMLDDGVIYPYVWSDPEAVRKARALDWSDVSALRAAYPLKSHAVTRWTHNW